jgi:hypothetical protein
MRKITFFTVLLVLVLSSLCTLGVRTAQAQDLDNVWFVLTVKSSYSEFEDDNLIKDSFAVEAFMLLENGQANDCDGLDYDYSLVAREDSPYQVIATGVFSTCGSNEKFMYSRVDIVEEDGDILLEYNGVLKIKKDKQDSLKSVKFNTTGCIHRQDTDNFPIVEIISQKCGIKGKNIDETALPFNPGDLAL